MAKRAIDLHPEVLRLRKALRRAIEEADWTLGELGEELSCNLYSILNGYQFLRAEHVFAILDKIGKTPAEFWTAMYAEPLKDDLVAGISRRQIEDVVRRAVGEELDARMRGRGGGTE